MRHTKLSIAVASAALLGAAACSSPVGLSRTSGAASSLNAVDRTFVAQAAYGSLAEATLGRLATTRAGSEGVRDFGRMMVETHDRINRDLVAVASDKGIAPPTAPDPGRQAAAAALAEFSGPAFDRQYVPQQLADHEAELTILQGQVKYGQDADLRAFAQRTIPEVERHIAMLRRLMSAQTASAEAHAH